MKKFGLLLLGVLTLVFFASAQETKYTNDSFARLSFISGNAYVQRAAEVILHRQHGILPRETLGQGMGPLTAPKLYTPETVVRARPTLQRPRAPPISLLRGAMTNEVRPYINRPVTKAGRLEARAITPAAAEPRIHEAHITGRRPRRSAM